VDKKKKPWVERIGCLAKKVRKTNRNGGKRKRGQKREGKELKSCAKQERTKKKKGRSWGLEGGSKGTRHRRLGGGGRSSDQAWKGRIPVVGHGRGSRNGYT